MKSTLNGVIARLTPWRILVRMRWCTYLLGSFLTWKFVTILTRRRSLRCLIKRVIMKRSRRSRNMIVNLLDPESTLISQLKEEEKSKYLAPRLNVRPPNAHPSTPRLYWISNLRSSLSSSWKIGRSSCGLRALRRT